MSALQKDMPRTLVQLLAQLSAMNITGYKRYRQIKSFLDSKARAKGIPLEGHFELTPLCNLDCKMCYVHLHKDQLHGARLLDAVQWKNIMKQAVEAGMLYATLSGGECLTYSAFRELYLYLQSMGVEVTVMTNGVLIDDELIRFFKENAPALIQITLYGASEDGYERVTGHRRFSVVYENIKRLLEAELPVMPVITPNAFMTDAEDTLRLIQGLGVETSINSGLLTPREETGRKLEDAQLETYVALLKLQRREKDSSGVPESEPAQWQKDIDAGDKEFELRCGAGLSGFAVDWQGNMKPCSFYPCEEVDIVAFGFLQAWQKTHEATIRYLIPSECRSCTYYSVCKNCVAEHALDAPAGHASRRVCEWTYRMIAEGLIERPQEIYIDQ